MKDTEALRRQLGELADETPEVSPQEWLAGARHKVRVRRRVRVIGAVGAIALALAVGTAVVPRMLDNSAPKPVEPVPTPDGQAGWAFPEVTQTDRVIASRVNDPGASEFVWMTRTEAPADTIFMTFCRLAERTEPGQPRIDAMLTINGRQAESQACTYRERYPPVHSSVVTHNMTPDFDKHYDVGPNEEFPVAMWLERRDERVEVTGAAFGFALVRCGPTPVVRDGSVLGGVGSTDCESLSFPGPGDAVNEAPFPMTQ